MSFTRTSWLDRSLRTAPLVEAGLGGFADAVGDQRAGSSPVGSCDFDSYLSKHRPLPIRTDRGQRVGGGSIWITGRDQDAGARFEAVAHRSVEVESTFHLLGQARAGDQEALERLFARHLKPLQRWARGRLPTWARDLADTDDLVQDTLAQTFKRSNTSSRAVSARCRRTPSGGAQSHPQRVAAERIEVGSGESPLEQAIGREALSAQGALQRQTAENGALRTLRDEQVWPQSRAVMASARTPHPRSRTTAC